MAPCPEHPKRDQTPKFKPPSETTSIPVCFIWECPPPPPPGKCDWKLQYEINVNAENCTIKFTQPNTCSGIATLACFEGVQRVAGRRKGTESLSAKCDWILQYEVNANVNAVSCTNKFTHPNKQLK